MSIESRGSPNIRATVIPYGNCVEEDAGLFEILDKGRGQDAQIAAGRTACNSCAQLSVCESSRNTIASVLYQKSDGQAMPFVGGEMSTPQAAEIRQTIIEPFVPFDLTKMPDDPALSLTFLRRALRSGKLSLGTRTAKTLPPLVDYFIQETAERDPDLHDWLTDPSPVKPEDLRKGISDMIVLLFQQADYARVVKRTPYEKRYDTNRIDMDERFEIVQLYARDTRLLSNKKFYAPTRQALAFGPDEYDLILKQYSYEISPSDMHNILQHNVYDPETALRQRLARLRILREDFYGTGVSEAALKQRSRWKLPGGRTPEIAPSPKSKPLLAAEVLGIYKEVDEHDGILPGDNVATPQETVAKLYGEFGKDIFYPDAATIGHIALQPLQHARTRCHNLIARAKTLSETPEGSQILPSIVKRLAARFAYISTGEELEREYLTERIQDRLAAQASRGSKKPLQIWTVRKILSLYDTFERADEAAGQAQSLVHAGILCVGQSELTMLQELNYRRQLNDICDDSSGKYITFSPALYPLTAQERLAFAAHHGLDRLLYGQDIDPKDVVELLGIRSLGNYAQNVTLHCRRLIAESQKYTGIPTVIMRLNADLDLLEWSSAQDEERKQSTVHLEPIETIVGGAAVQLGLASVELTHEHKDYGKDFDTWLKQTIFVRCKPYHNEMAPDVERAIIQGVLVITGNCFDNYKVRFSDRIIERSDELEVATLAISLGIDTFMYGCSVDEILEARTGSSGAAQSPKSDALVNSLETTGPEPAPQLPLRERLNKEILRQRQESLHQLDMAVSVLVRAATKGFTNEQANHFKQLFAHHIGRLREPPQNARLNNQLFVQGLRSLASEYEQYLIANKHDSETTQAVAALFDCKSNTVPVGLLPLLGRHSSMLSQQELRIWHTRINRELIAFSQDIALKARK